MSDALLIKSKNSKRNAPESRTTLDAIHIQKVKAIQDEKECLTDYKKSLETLQEKIKNTTSDIELWRLEREETALKKKIDAIEDDSELQQYYLRTGEILYNYYDIQDQIQHTSQINRPYNISKAKPGSILALLQDIGSPPKNSIISPHPPSENKSLQRNQLLNDYLHIENPEMARDNAEEINNNWTMCDLCGHEMNICLNEANLTCAKCGNQEFILVDTDKPSYKDPPRDICYYAYKKINHFNEWLAQFQAKESTEIPTDIYDSILLQLKKERITNMSTLKPVKLREILRNMKCSKYYEHIPHIINRLNGINAPFMSREDEEKLRHMFREIQPSFKNHCPKGRRNFLSYGYVLYKFCELLEMDEYLACFPLLKNRDKLYLQDKVWQLICKDMKWMFISTTN
jgi:hypothetical protein